MKTLVLLSVFLFSMGFMFVSDGKPSKVYENRSFKLELRSDGTFSISHIVLHGGQNGLFYFSKDSTQLQLFPFFSHNDSVLVFEQKYSKKLKLEKGFIKLVNKSNDVLLFSIDSTWREVKNTILPKSNIKFFTSEFGFKDVVVDEGVNEIVIKKVPKRFDLMKKLRGMPFIEKNQYCIYNKDSITLTINKDMHVLKRSEY